MIRLAGQVGGGLVVDAVLCEPFVSQVCPQHGDHAQLVRPLERGGDLLDLSPRLGRAEVDRRSDGGRPEVECLVHRAEQPLVVRVRVAQHLVVVDLDDEGDLVRIFPRDGAENAQRGGDRIAAALDRQLHDVPRVEVDRVGREGRAGRVFDPLIDGQDRHVSGACESAVIEDRLQVPQNAGGPVRGGEHVVDERRPGQVQRLPGDGLALVVQHPVGVASENLPHGVAHLLSPLSISNPIDDAHPAALRLSAIISAYRTTSRQIFPHKAICRVPPSWDALRIVVHAGADCVFARRQNRVFAHPADSISCVC